MKSLFDFRKMKFSVRLLESSGADNSDNTDGSDSSGGSRILGSGADTSGMVPAGWESRRFGFPVRDLTFSYPADDEARVRAWFTGNYSGVTRPASDTLRRNVASAIHDALDKLGTDAALEGAFAAPFRVALGRRMKKGFALLTDWVVVNPWGSSPEIAVRDYNVSEKQAEVYCEFRYKPVKVTLEVDAGPLTNREDLVVVAGPQIPFYEGGGKVSACYRAVLDGALTSFFDYPGYSAEELDLLVTRSADLRIIGEAGKDLQIEESGEHLLLPLSAPTDWKSLEKYAEGDTSPGSTGEVGAQVTEGEDFEWPEGEVEILTQWVSVGGYPVGRIWLRGVFPSDVTEIDIEVSSHREIARSVARGHGRFISGLRGLRVRWMRFRIKTRFRPGDFLEKIEGGSI